MGTYFVSIATCDNTMAFGLGLGMCRAYNSYVVSGNLQLITMTLTP